MCLANQEGSFCFNSLKLHTFSDGENLNCDVLFVLLSIFPKHFVLIESKFRS